MNFIWEALATLFIGFFLLRMAGKKTVTEMTGLEIITLLTIASVIGHAVPENGFVKTILILCIFVALLIAIQYMAIKFDWIEKIFMGKATLVIQEGKVITENLKRLRMSVDQLESMIREKGIASCTDIKYATIEISGHLGYELMGHAKPITLFELEKLLAQFNLHQQPQEPNPSADLFEEIVQQNHQTDQINA